RVRTRGGAVTAADVARSPVWVAVVLQDITTILNSRTAVLAAATPVFGRYDDMKTPTENIDFQTTILSRFDIIFIIKDV
ncbi:hypothetical protein ACO1M1_14815, partial [Staphylococcus aureus]